MSTLRDALFMIKKLHEEFEFRFARQDAYLRNLEDEMKALKNNLNQQILEVTKAAIKELVDSAHAEISQFCKQLIDTNAKQLVEFYKDVRAAFRDLVDEEKASGSSSKDSHNSEGLVFTTSEDILADAVYCGLILNATRGLVFATSGDILDDAVYQGLDVGDERPGGMPIRRGALRGRVPGRGNEMVDGVTATDSSAASHARPNPDKVEPVQMNVPIEVEPEQGNVLPPENVIPGQNEVNVGVAAILQQVANQMVTLTQAVQNNPGNAAPIPPVEQGPDKWLQDVIRMHPPQFDGVSDPSSWENWKGFLKNNPKSTIHESILMYTDWESPKNNNR
ncbi:hypothetical protein OROGR_010589 [Orobanche gracilis]